MCVSSLYFLFMYPRLCCCCLDLVWRAGLSSPDSPRLRLESAVVVQGEQERYLRGRRGMCVGGVCTCFPPRAFAKSLQGQGIRQPLSLARRERYPITWTLLVWTIQPPAIAAGGFDRRSRASISDRYDPPVFCRRCLVYGVGEKDQGKSAPLLGLSLIHI